MVDPQFSSFEANRIMPSGICACDASASEYQRIRHGHRQLPSNNALNFSTSERSAPSGAAHYHSLEKVK